MKATAIFLGFYFKLNIVRPTFRKKKNVGPGNLGAEHLFPLLLFLPTQEIALIENRSLPIHILCMPPSKQAGRQSPAESLRDRFLHASNPREKSSAPLAVLRGEQVVIRKDGRKRILPLIYILFHVASNSTDGPTSCSFVSVTKSLYIYI